MTPKKIYTYIGTILFMFAATSFTSCLAKEAWQRCYYIDRPRAFENYYCASACKNGVFVASRTPDGQIFLSINGKIVWWNKYADPKRNEPSVLVNFSAGAVTDWDISYTGGNIFPQTTIKGTVYAVCGADAIKNPKNKRLYTFEKGNGGGYYWKLDESLTKPAQMVCAARDGSVVVLCDDGPYLKTADGSWNTLGTIKDLKQVAVGNKDAIFALSDKDEVLTWKNNTWMPLQTKNPKSNIRHIAVNPKGVLYCTDKTGKALYFSDSSQTWNLLPNISNAQQISVMDKEYCWTSQPYGNAMVKNAIPSFIEKAIAVQGFGILGTGAAIAGTTAVAGAGAGALAVGVGGNILLNVMAIGGLSTFISSVGVIGLGGTVTAALSVGSFGTGGVALLFAPAAIAVGAVVAVPVIIVGTATAAALFGSINLFLSRPHCNKIFVHNSDVPENAPDETAPEISTVPAAAPETATSAAPAPAVQPAPTATPVPTAQEATAPAAAPVAPTPAQTPTTPKVSTVYTGYGSDL